VPSESLPSASRRCHSAQVPNLYGPEEMDAIMSACRVDCQKKQITPTKTNIFAQYVVRVRRNMHV
jgi:dynein heavy chain